MTASAIDFVSTNAEELVGQGDFVRRSAFYLNEEIEPVFTWLHQPAHDRHFDHGAIVCPPIGYEQIHSHRSLRHLADRLATQRIPTLRIDWHGTGDSPGIDEDPLRYRTWLTNIAQAAQWLRDEMGCRKVSLIGLRMGATLAALATEETEIESLVLWSPVIKGRAYVREMKAIDLTSETCEQSATTGPHEIEAAGFILNSETAADLNQIDLLKNRPRCGRILVVSRKDLPDDDRLCNQWATLGIRVQQIAMPGFAEMMAEPHRSQVPDAAIDQISDWLTNEIKIDSKLVVTHDEAIRPSSISIPMFSSVSDQPDKQIRESTFAICSRPDLFGIISEPNCTADVGLPMIVLLNAGSTHRIGPNRLNVFIARRLAAEGFRCLRMDLNGLGDSVSKSADVENDPYPATAFRDIDLTLKQIEQTFGTKRFVLMGLCSGAYAAFQSAVQIPNPGLLESVLINPLTYFWKEGMTLNDSPTEHLTTFHHHRNAVFNPRKWWKLLSGRSNIGVTGAIILLARRLKILNRSDHSPTVTKHGPSGSLGLSHPQKEDLPGDLTRVARANRKLAMFFSATDPGFAILNFYARRKANQLRTAGQLNVQFIDNADHTFTKRAARIDLLDAITHYLGKRYASFASDELVEVHQHS